MKYLGLISCVIGLGLFAAGCATSDDPRSGGLFGYSPSKYEQRIADREAKLKAIEEEQRAEESQTAALKAQKAKLTKEVNSLKSKFTSQQSKLDKNLSSIKNGANSSKVQDLQNRSAALKQQAADLDSMKDIEAKKAEIVKLQKELKELELEADALSRL